MARTARQKAAARANLAKARAARKRKGGSALPSTQAHYIRNYKAGLPASQVRHERAFKGAVHPVTGTTTVKTTGKFVTHRQAIKTARAKAGLNQLAASRAHRALKGR
jgi:hypothetical protein